MLTDSFLTRGQPEPPTELIRLRAGPLTMLYDPTSGFVRRIKLGEREVLRGIYAAVRDRNWGTVPAKLRETLRKITPDSFRIGFESEHRQGDVHFVWRGLVHGTADGNLRYEFDGEARTTFLRNRIGFCVLHPIRECAGLPAKQFRLDGIEVASRFPDLIEPQIFGRSSFQELCGVAHEVAPGIWAQVDFEGDTFEMEDQRNWTDASFKTYCTPLARPFPVEIKSGTAIRQSVTLRLKGDLSRSCGPQLEAVTESTEVLTLTIPDQPTGRLPQLGLGAASHGAPLTAIEIAQLRQLQLSHLRVDVRLAAPDWTTTLAQAASEAQQIGTRLELALHLPRHGLIDFSVVTDALKPLTPLLARVLALRRGDAATTPETLAEIKQHLGCLRLPLGGGSDGNFCELNREHALNRFALADSDFVFWSMNPQVHACDHLSIMETLEAQTATVRSARAWAGDRPLVVSPVTLKQRFNPVATGAETPIATDVLPPHTDPRQLSHFAAAWTLGSIAALASAGITSATYYETTGARGVMERTAGSAMPDKFPSLAGGLFPVFDVFVGLAGCQQFAIAQSAATSRVTALALFAAGKVKRVLIANLTAQSQSVCLIGSISTAAPIRLQPYGLIRMDSAA
jgi:hypothetical protein